MLFCVKPVGAALGVTPADAVGLGAGDGVVPLLGLYGTATIASL